MQITDLITKGSQKYDCLSAKITYNGVDVTCVVVAAHAAEGWCEILLTHPPKPGEPGTKIPMYLIGSTDPDGKRGAIEVRLYGDVVVTGELREDAS